MKFVDEYRSAKPISILVKKISGITIQSWTIMEVCGGQTHSIIRFGVDELLPENVTLVHGPGCPVCVTAVETVDKAINIASRKNVIFCSFGDMLRVPGTAKDLLTVKAEGGDIRTVYSPLEALNIANDNPDKQVVFFAIGFETTAPSTAMTIIQACRRNIENFFMLVAHVLVIPAMEALLAMPGNRVQGFLAAGHVCAITGYAEYEPMAEKFKVPIVVTGFEPLDILQGIYLCLQQLENGTTEVLNQYSRAVNREENKTAINIINSVFEITDRNWRGIGTIPKSGWKLRKEFADLDAEIHFDITDSAIPKNTECISGEILRGACKPYECPAFGSRCTPEHPLGATMVSSEGACAAYYHYRKS